MCNFIYIYMGCPKQKPKRKKKKSEFLNRICVGYERNLKNRFQNQGGDARREMERVKYCKTLKSIKSQGMVHFNEEQ